MVTKQGASVKAGGPGASADDRYAAEQRGFIPSRCVCMNLTRLPDTCFLNATKTGGREITNKGNKTRKHFSGKEKHGSQNWTPPRTPKCRFKVPTGHPPNSQQRKPTNLHEPTTLNTSQTKTRVGTGKGKTPRGNQKGKRERETSPHSKMGKQKG